LPYIQVERAQLPQIKHLFSSVRELPPPVMVDQGNGGRAVCLTTNVTRLTSSGWVASMNPDFMSEELPQKSSDPGEQSFPIFWAAD
jgi:hypothetical protein